MTTAQENKMHEFRRSLYNCYGCRGEGMIHDHPCTCVLHTEDCEPEGCDPQCLAGANDPTSIRYEGDTIVLTYEEDPFA